MLLDIKKQLSGMEVPIFAKGELVCSADEFSDFSLIDPIQYTVKTVFQHELLRLDISMNLEVSAHCGRCLMPTKQRFDLGQSFEISLEDLRDPDFELNFTRAGTLDLDELILQEIQLQLPVTFLCDEDCKGLCATCGLLKQSCSCDQTPQQDPRWQSLLDAWNKND